MPTTITALPATRALRHETTIAHRVRRYEAGLLAVLASRAPEGPAPHRKGEQRNEKLEQTTS